MPANCEEIVSQVFVNVMEQTAFMFGEPAEKEELSLEGTSLVQASMSFRGPIGGGLVIAVPQEGCLAITANVMGMEPDDAFVAERATDSLKEILNITCGHILTELAGEKPVFDLSIPEVVPLEGEQIANLLADERTVAFVVDDCPMLVRLIVDGE